MKEVIRGHGHEHVSAEHASTFELTSDDYLTPAGDCILGIEADRVPADFDDDFVAACQSHDADIVVSIEAGEYTERIEGRGHPDIELTNERSAVGRTSDYVDDRTIVVGADVAAGDLDRDLVAALAEGAEVTMTITVD